VRKEKRIDLQINFFNWKKGISVERTGLNDRERDILGLNIPLIEIPVRPGRDMALLVEVAAMVRALKQMGHDSASEFNQKLIKLMENKK
jgi:HPr kinase/phosphorylase